MVDKFIEDEASNVTVDTLVEGKTGEIDFDTLKSGGLIKQRQKDHALHPICTHSAVNFALSGCCVVDSLLRP